MMVVIIQRLYLYTKIVKLNSLGGAIIAYTAYTAFLVIFAMLSSNF